MEIEAVMLQPDLPTHHRHMTILGSRRIWIRIRVAIRRYEGNRGDLTIDYSGRSKYRSNKKFQEDDENRVAIRRYEGNRGDLTIDY
jgi:hypothetical protein